MHQAKVWTAIDRLLIMWKFDLSDKIKWNFFPAAVVLMLLFGYTTWTLIIYSYADACRNIFHAITTSSHSSLEKYTSHFIERERELETEQNCNILTPQLFWLSQPFFPVLLGCSTGGLGAQPLLGHGSHSSTFSPTDLNFLSPGLYNNLMPTYFLRASQFTLNSTL